MQVNDDEVLVPLTKQDIEDLYEVLTYAGDTGFGCEEEDQDRYFNLMHKFKDMLYGS